MQTNGSYTFNFTILDVAGLLNLEVRHRGGKSIDVDCPLCGKKGKMTKNVPLAQKPQPKQQVKISAEQKKKQSNNSKPKASGNVNYVRTVGKKKNTGSGTVVKKPKNNGEQIKGVQYKDGSFNDLYNKILENLYKFKNAKAQTEDYAIPDISVLSGPNLVNKKAPSEEKNTWSEDMSNMVKTFGQAMESGLHDIATSSASLLNSLSDGSLAENVGLDCVDIELQVKIILLMLSMSWDVL